MIVEEVDVKGRNQPISVRIERTDRANAKDPHTYKGGSGTRSYQWVREASNGCLWKFFGATN